MFKPNGLPLSLRRTSKLARWNNAVSVMWTMLRRLPPPVRLALALLLLMLVLSVTGCATTSTAPESMPRNPEPPPSALPTSPPNYLTDAQQAISQWRKLLNELTAKPAN